MGILDAPGVTPKAASYVYAPDSLLIQPAEMVADTGTPVLSVLGRRSYWAFPTAATTIMRSSVLIPDHWTSFDVSVISLNPNASTTGIVSFRADAQDYNEDDLLFNNPTAGTQVNMGEIPSQYKTKEIRLIEGRALAGRKGRILAINIMRVTGAGDTFASSIGVLGIRVTNASAWPGRAQRHLIVTGQSLAVGVDSLTALTTTADPSGEVKTVTAGVVVNETGGGTVELPQSQLIRRAHTLSPGRWSVATCGIAGASYTALRRGSATGSAFRSSINDLETLTSAIKGGVEVSAVHNIHGETDTQGGVTAAGYVAWLRQWLDSYWDCVRRVNKQPTRMPMILCQVSSWDAYVSFPTVTLGQLDAHRTYTDMLLVGPKYQLPTAVADATKVHLTEVGYYRLAEYHAKVLAKVIAGQTWHPIHPQTITIAGSVITINFHVPVGNLVFDTAGDVPAQTNMGFKFTDSTTSATISSVAITGPAQVQITLSNPPTGTSQKIRYACDTRYGNLRDSDPAVSGYDGHNLYNWCVAFNDPIPYTGV